MDDQVWLRWERQWRAALAGVTDKGAPAVASPLVIASPALPADLAALNAQGIELPVEYQDVIESYSSRVAFHWRLFEAGGPASIQAPLFGARTPQWGGCHMANLGGSDSRGALWSAPLMPLLQNTYHGWLDNAFLPWLAEKPDDIYARPWLDKLPFIQVGDGDMIAFDLSLETFGRVVYLCHDDACHRIHGQALGTDFVDFMTRWTRVGCVGPEGWFLELFWDGQEFAAAESETVIEWRD